MAKVNADPEAIRRYSRQVKQYVRAQEELIRKLRGQYSQLGGQWRDMQYSRFGEALNDLEKAIRKTGPAFADYARKLDGKAKQLDEFSR